MKFELREHTPESRLIAEQQFAELSADLFARMPESLRRLTEPSELNECACGCGSIDKGVSLSLARAVGSNSYAIDKDGIHKLGY